MVTIPGASTDNIVSSPNTGVGGDIVANFKAIADVINPEGTTAGCQALNVGCNFNAGLANTPQGVLYHILNNNAHGVEGSEIPPSGSDYAFPGSGDTPNGMQSGAFMKGVLFDASFGFPSSGYKLFDVPYYGCIIINMQIIIVDSNSYLHPITGTIYVYPQAVDLLTIGGSDVNGTGMRKSYYGQVYIEPDEDFRQLLTLSVSNGDLIIQSSGENDVRVVQIGMHGTVLTGVTDEINSGQAGHNVMPGWGSSS